jgi:hypothetical protein
MLLKTDLKKEKKKSAQLVIGLLAMLKILLKLHFL